MARRVVVTGIGIVSCLGNDADTVAAALKAGQSGISFCEAHAEAGMRSHVAGQPDINLAEHIDRKQWRFMGDAAGYAYLSMQQAIEDARLTEEQVSNPRTGIVAGSGGASSASQVDAADTLRERGLRRVGPLSRDSNHGEHRVRLSRDSFQNQRGQLLDFISLLHQRPLHW